ncbi:flagellar biosynthetic protein FliO [Pseudoalteromonas denitrificans]|jgi:flagellar protein FliO/FliZ|uniref:Flagellar protein n=1 Tax=Pseudoalteromonas denitrificans DSM 6059 TaxID=1123010 RepID=A0A1I1HHC6_9GAMM|nr:flagellar biosynthetic protein FliO [Pseudoalteromonas denitrificans]SFC23437.1 flagellar protein FliO/FliZ [Pseudoalteromonas denitrificans DSM 6059]
MKKGLFFIVLFLQAHNVFAAPGVENLMSVAMSLAIVIFAIVILAMLVKRFNPHLTDLDEFKVIRSIPLGSKERLIVVEIDEKQHLLGVTPQTINYLYQLEKPLEAKEMPQLAKTFSQLLGAKKSNFQQKNNKNV